MKRSSFVGVLLLCIGASAALMASRSPQNPAKPVPAVAQVRVMPPPPARPATDEFFGTKVEDPYRYLENLHDKQVEAWFQAQDAQARRIFRSIPARAALLARIKELDESTPARVSDVRRLAGGRVFYQKRAASEDMPKLYVRDGLTGAERLLVDPATFGKAGESKYSINYYAPSFDGRHVAVGVSPAGSEDAVLHVIDVESRKQTGDVIDRAQFGSPSWLPDGRAFVYNRLQQLGPATAPTERYQKSRAYLHVLGQDPGKDAAVFGFDVSPSVTIAPTDIPFVVTVPGSTWSVGIIAHGVQNEATVYVAPTASLTGASVPWKKVCDIEDAVTSLDVHNDDLFLLSHKGAPRFKVLRTSAAKPDVAHAEVVVPPAEAVVRAVSAAQDALYVQTLDGGIGRLLRVPYGGKPEPVSLPFNGAVAFAAADPRVPGVLLDMRSWTKATAIYSYDPRSRQIADTGLQPIGPNDAPTDLESAELKVKSYDGTLVPLSVTHRKGLKANGANPTVLVGYGAYGITEDPAFDPKLLAWYEAGGVYAVAHVRGGGEYGEDWHLAGKGLTKPNTWKDFIACAQFLIDDKVTDSAHLGGLGGSAGGITIGRSITERPDLFAAVIDAVPASDMLRMELTPNGPPNIPEFGTVKTADGFKALHEMSSYHHVKDGTPYPGVLVTTGWNDPRVISWEPGKMAARLQKATTSGRPVLLRVDYEAGHGIGTSKTQRQEEMADEFSFLLWQFGVAAYQPKMR